MGRFEPWSGRERDLGREDREVRLESGMRESAADIEQEVAMDGSGLASARSFRFLRPNATLYLPLSGYLLSYLCIYSIYLLNHFLKYPS